jgi:group I intron endonuclease
MDKICGIYKITSPSGKIYIGQSKDIKRRISEHKRNNHNYQPRLHNSITKYGWNNHKIEIIHLCDESELNDLEKSYIKIFNTFNTEHGMNLTEGGNYTKMSNETKDKMKSARKINDFWRGRKHTEESKLKMRDSHIGYTPHLGRKHTEEAKMKMSNSLKGRYISEETRKKIIKGL